MFRLVAGHDQRPRARGLCEHVVESVGRTRRGRNRARPGAGARARAGGRGRERAAAAFPARTTRRAGAALPRGRSARAASRWFRAARARGRAARRDRGSRAPSAPCRRAPRARDSRDAARESDLDLARRRREQASDEGEERRLPRAVRARDDEELPGPHLEVEVAQTRLEPNRRPSPRAEITPRRPGARRGRTSTLMTPFMVKNAMSSRFQSLGETSECS